MRKAKRALISVFDKEGVTEFVGGLRELGVEIISTGGTAAHLRSSGIDVEEVGELVGLSEMLGGRVKTLHPRVHAGILASRRSEAHRLEMEKRGWDYIDIVAVNLPPPRERSGPEAADIVGEMDIGGHALLRAAAKNFVDVIVVCNPARYGLVLDELNSGDGTIPEGLRARLAKEALETTSRYDAVYCRCLREACGPAAGILPAELELELPKLSDLRYGENPHQRAAVYRMTGWVEPSVISAELLHGKALSFNNYTDLEIALEIVKGLRRPACAIVKHAIPCGAGLGEDAREAYGRARETDPDSSFGGIVGFNVAVSAEVAKQMAETFLECIIAPWFDGDALDMLKRKRNLRLLRVPGLAEWLEGGGRKQAGLELRQLTGGVLLQERDLASVGPGDIRCVTEMRPGTREAGAIFFAWSLVRWVRSNAIVVATASETVGVGAGQMSRVDAARLAVSKARKPVEGCAAASDGFFPFRDAVEVLAKAGVKTIVQPGGSKRDGDIIAACNELGVAMVFTGMRGFKH